MHYVSLRHHSSLWMIYWSCIEAVGRFTAPWIGLDYQACPLRTDQSCCGFVRLPQIEYIPMCLHRENAVSDWGPDCGYIFSPNSFLASDQIVLLGLLSRTHGMRYIFISRLFISTINLSPLWDYFFFASNQTEKEIWLCSVPCWWVFNSINWWCHARQPDENNETLLDSNACSGEKFAAREPSIQNIERSAEVLEHDTSTE